MASSLGPDRDSGSGSRPEEAAVEASVVIACYNGEETLAATLEGVVGQHWDGRWEIVLSDNGSTDRSVAIFETIAWCHPELTMRVVDASQRPGQPHALNVGVEAAAGRYILLCDADDVPAPGWLRAMTEALESHHIVAARFEITRLNPGWTQGYRNNLQVSTLERLPFPPYCRHAAGATMGFRKSVFDQVGRFDNEFRALQDTDFCIRAQLHGYELQYVPEAVMHYRFRANLDSIYRQSYSYGKDAVLLAKRYRDRGAPPRGRWARFFGSWGKLSRWYISASVRRRPASMVDQAKFQRLLGREAGRLAGVLEYRTIKVRFFRRLFTPSADSRS